MSEKSIINCAYHASIISGLTLGYTMIAKSLLKIKAPDLAKLDFEDSSKLVVLITASIATKDFLVKQGIIPENLNM